jgi:site-specific recombinase XerD
LEQLSAWHIRLYLAHLSSTPSEKTRTSLSTYTVHGYAQVIKGWLSWCQAEGLVNQSAAARVDMPDVDEKVIETFTPAHVKALFAATIHAPTPTLEARDRAILALLFDTGIRRQ